MGGSNIKAVLINPFPSGKHPDEYIEVPLNLLYVGTKLRKKGHTVRILDYQICSIEQEIKNHVQNADLVGIGAMTPQVGHSVEISKIIREISDVPIVWGGQHPTIYPEQTVESKVVDYVIRGDGEEPIAKLIDFISGKCDIKKVPSLFWMEKEKHKSNPQAQFTDINKISPPDWSLIDMQVYTGNQIVNGEKVKTFTINSGRGCIHRCAFCINTFQGRVWRKMEAINITNEMNILYNKYNVKYIFFRDDNLFIDKKRILSVARYVRDNKMDMKWSGSCRADYFKESHLNDETVKVLSQCGLCNFAMGIESGSQRMLNLMKKDITLQDSINAVRTASKYGVECSCSFVVGAPTETEKELEETLKFILLLDKEAKPKGLGFAGINIYTPYPGSELFDMAVESGLKIPDNLEGWKDIGIDTPLPWISKAKRKKLKLLDYYCNLAISNPKNFVYRYLNKAARFRVTKNFFMIPIEKKIVDFIKKRRG